MRWILAGKKSPKEGERVLVTAEIDGRKWVGDMFYHDDNAWNKTVIAWMPLPTPYKGGDAE